MEVQYSLREEGMTLGPTVGEGDVFPGLSLPGNIRGWVAGPGSSQGLGPLHCLSDHSRLWLLSLGLEMLSFLSFEFKIFRPLPLFFSLSKFPSPGFCNNQNQLLNLLSV